MSSIEDIVIDIQRGKSSKNTLYTRIYKLLYMFCGKYANYALKRGFSIDDLMSFAWLGVENAIQAFNTDKGVKFTTFLTFYVKSAISRGLKHDEPDDKLRSLSEPIPGADRITLGDTIEDETAAERFETADGYDYYNVLYDELLKLPTEQMDAIVQKFMNGKSLQSIAEGAGVSTECIRQRQQKGLRRLRASRQLKACYYDAAAYRHVGVQQFNRTWTSATEFAALEHLRKLCKEGHGQRGGYDYEDIIKNFAGAQ